jgi:hypothetical protein
MALRPGSLHNVTSYRYGAAITLLLLALSGCGQTDQQSNPFLRSAATQTAAALGGVPPSSVGADDLSAPLVATPTATALPAPTVSSVEALPTPSVLVPTPTTAPTEPAATVVLPTLPTVSYEQRWRNQQENRVVFEGGPRTYNASGLVDLWWFDPVSQQSVRLGSIRGPFLAQAQFVLRGQGAEALEVPYQINVDYGLTTISPAFVERMARAGYTEFVETYVYLTPEVSPL